MKDLTVLVSRYTKSLYSLAKEQSIVPAVYKDLSKLNEALEASGKYKDIALNPKVPARMKAAIWGVLMDPIKVNGITAMFIKLMLDNSRIHLFPKVIRKYQDMVLADSGIKGVKLYTSVKLSKAESAEVTDKLEALLDSKVELESIVEPAMIGGMIAKFDSYMIDGSIRSKLNKIKTELLSEDLVVRNVDASHESEPESDSMGQKIKDSIKSNMTKGKKGEVKQDKNGGVKNNEA